ncbi:type 1 glutamine amidotransferase [Emcibacter sp. SYSU 3D8]|uniref:type 1 glutamine amidotransferase n=1 Tax=Emcibacter sp. SYSU 3D8 TaxID=3133969 RepID=UPI0031FF06F0
MKLLIADIYSANGRTGIVASGGTKAGDMFDRAVRLHRPDAEISVLTFDTASPDMPGPIEAYDGVIWSGSNLTIHRPNPLIDAQIEMARTAFDRGVPQFGVCYGIQLATVAAGGKVVANPNGPEIGWARGVTLTDAGRNHPMYRGKVDRFDALCWHNDTVWELPENADLLAGNAHSDVQAAILRRGRGEFWAVQYHLEFDSDEVARLVGGNAPALVQAGTLSEEGAAAIVADMQALSALAADPSAAPDALKPVVDPLTRTAELGNWLDRVDALGGR